MTWTHTATAAQRLEHISGGRRR